MNLERTMEAMPLNMIISNGYGNYTGKGQILRRVYWHCAYCLQRWKTLALNRVHLSPAAQCSTNSILYQAKIT